jgi:hypothetical protein
LLTDKALQPSLLLPVPQSKDKAVWRIPRKFDYISDNGESKAFPEPYQCSKMIEADILVIWRW